MKNIIKAQLLRLRKDKLCLLAFLCILAVSMIVVWTAVDMLLNTFSHLDLHYSGGEEVISLFNVFQFLAQTFLYVFTAQACGADFLDKTCNYEIMSGHTRREVYFGRVIPTLVIGVLGVMTLIAVPAAVEVFMLGGWGDKVSLSDMLLRFLLLMFPMARIVCEYIMLTFLIKKSYIVMGISYVACVTLGINTLVNEKTMFAFGMTNATAITTIDTWCSFGLGGDEYYIYETALTADIVVPTILVSVIVSGIALFLGYVFFKNDDMH